jgi:hypothetical protein
MRSFMLEADHAAPQHDADAAAPERCLKISTAILSACRCLSNDDISNSIRAIAATNPPSTTGGSLLGLEGV